MTDYLKFITGPDVTSIPELVTMFERTSISLANKHLWIWWVWAVFWPLSWNCSQSNSEQFVLSSYGWHFHKPCWTPRKHSWWSGNALSEYSVYFKEACLHIYDFSSSARSAHFAQHAPLPGTGGLRGHCGRGEGAGGGRGHLLAAVVLGSDGTNNCLLTPHFILT